MEENMDIVLYSQLQKMVLRLHKLFLFTQGLLTGVCLLHVYIVYSNDDAQQFIKIYSGLARWVGAIITLLSALALVGSLELLMGERVRYRMMI